MRLQLFGTEEVWKTIDELAEKKYPGKGTRYFIQMELSRKLQDLNVSCLEPALISKGNKKRHKVMRTFRAANNLDEKLRCLSKQYNISLSSLVSMITIGPFLIGKSE